MKLNLLPTTVSKEKKARGAILGAALLGIAGIVAGVFLATTSAAAATKAKDEEASARTRAQQAVDTAAQADTIIANAKGIITNSNLASAMLRHSRVYPDTYDKILPYVPSFFRVTSISAQPADAATARVTITGVLDTYQQYANLMLAFLRSPDVTAVGRSNYIYRDLSVPQLTPDDQYGKPLRPGATPVPDDPLQRLAYFESQPQPPEYAGVGSFGDPTVTLRGAGPNSSLVTVVLTMKAALQAPDVKATLAGSATPGGAAAGGAPTGFPGGMPSGMPGAAGGRGPQGGGDDDR